VIDAAICQVQPWFFGGGSRFGLGGGAEPCAEVVGGRRSAGAAGGRLAADFTGRKPPVIVIVIEKMLS